MPTLLDDIRSDPTRLYKPAVALFAGTVGFYEAHAMHLISAGPEIALDLATAARVGAYVADEYGHSVKLGKLVIGKLGPITDVALLLAANTVLTEWTDRALNTVGLSPNRYMTYASWAAIGLSLHAFHNLRPHARAGAVHAFRGARGLFRRTGPAAYGTGRAIHGITGFIRANHMRIAGVAAAGVGVLAGSWGYYNADHVYAAISSVSGALQPYVGSIQRHTGNFGAAAATGMGAALATGLGINAFLTAAFAPGHFLKKALGYTISAVAVASVIGAYAYVTTGHSTILETEHNGLVQLDRGIANSPFGSLASSSSQSPSATPSQTFQPIDQTVHTGLNQVARLTTLYAKPDLTQRIRALEPGEMVCVVDSKIGTQHVTLGKKPDGTVQSYDKQSMIVELEMENGKTAYIEAAFYNNDNKPVYNLVSAQPIVAKGCAPTPAPKG